MSDHDRSFERLRRANPAPTRVAEERPSAQEMLASVKEMESPGVRDVGTLRARGGLRRGFAVAAAAFVAVVVLAIPLLLFLDGSTERPVAATTTPPVSTSAPQPTTTTTSEAALSPPQQQLVEAFVAAYNAGDTEAFMASLHPDFRREIRRELALEPIPLDSLRTLYEIDAALHTEITLDCVPGTSALICDLQRYDDLHRVLGIGPTDDRRWLLTFEDGLLINWSESRQNFAVEYEAEAIGPFLAWLREHRPEVQSPYPVTDGDWVVRDGIVDEMGELVADWAESQGVDLGS